LPVPLEPSFFNAVSPQLTTYVPVFALAGPSSTLPAACSTE